ncbi:unnamed protein product [Sympodiomycopsis kandeliae]
MAFNFAQYAQQQAKNQFDPAESLTRQVNFIISQIDLAVQNGASTDTASSSASVHTNSASTAISILQSSQLVRNLSKLSNAGSESASASLRKLSTKANSMITSHVARTEALYSGYALAFEVAEQTGWSSKEENIIERYGQEWIGAALTYLAVASGQAPPSASIAKGQDVRPEPRVLNSMLLLILNHIISPEAQSRPEYARAVVTPNLPKLANALVTCAESILKRHDQPHGTWSKDDVSSLDVLASAILQQLQSQPNIYRPFVSRLHSITSPLVTAPTSPPAIVDLATRLLGNLYLTGAISGSAGKAKELAGSIASGKASQAQLWLATLLAAVNSTRDAWSACVNTFDNGKDGSRSVTQKDRLPFPQLPEDSFQAQEVAEARLDRLLGAESSDDGVLLRLLQMPTRKAVPVPFKALLSLCFDMLSVTSDTPSRISVDANLHATQSIKLPVLHLRALRLLSVVITAVRAGGHAAMARFGPRVLDKLVRVIERRPQSIESVDPTRRSVRGAASRLIAQLLADSSMQPLDPSSALTLRAARACLNEISQLFVDDGHNHVAGSSNASVASTSGQGRQNKKRSRMYDSDSVLSNGAAAQVLHGKSAEDQESAVGCLSAFPLLFAHLCTSLTPAHYDLAHTGAQLVVTLSELLVRSAPPYTGTPGSAPLWSSLTSASLRSLASLITQCSGSTPFLALLVSRASHLAEHTNSVAGTAYPAVNDSASALSIALRNVTQPRLPPVLATQIDVSSVEEHAEEEGRNGWEMDIETGKAAKSLTGPVRGGSDNSGSALTRTIDAIEQVTGSSIHRREDQTEITEVVMEEHIEAPAAAETTPLASKPYSGPRHSSPARTTHPDSTTLPSSTSEADVDPIKPLHRPTTPRIGTSPSRSASNVTVPTPGSPEAKEIFGGGAMSPSPRPSATFSQPKNAQFQTVVSSTTTTTTTTTTSDDSKNATAKLAIGSDMDSDDEMPEIDIRSSDEGEDDEEE